jgi:uncharacterized membrane protein YesL
MFCFEEIIGVAMLLIGATIAIITNYVQCYRSHNPIVIYVLYGIGFALCFIGSAIAMSCPLSDLYELECGLYS